MSENALTTITLVQSWLKTNCVKHCKNLRTLLRCYVGFVFSNLSAEGIRYHSPLAMVIASYPLHNHNCALLYHIMVLLAPYFLPCKLGHDNSFQATNLKIGSLITINEHFQTLKYFGIWTELRLFLPPHSAGHFSLFSQLGCGSNAYKWHRPNSCGWSDYYPSTSVLQFCHWCTLHWRTLIII